MGAAGVALEIQDAFWAEFRRNRLFRDGAADKMECAVALKIRTGDIAGVACRRSEMLS
jgi:hypothetical protein